MKSRLLSVLPARWFGLVGVDASSTNLSSAAPVLNGLLSGFSAGLSLIFDLFANVRQQARLATATSEFLDMAAADYFGGMLSRRASESDNAFRSRICANLLLRRGTRGDVINVLTLLTGRAPTLFEPARTTDTGGYGETGWKVYGFAYGAAGGWGSIEMPFEYFVTAFRPLSEGIALLGGYGTGGYHAYGDLSMVTATVSDPEIYAAIAQTIPVASVAWVRIEG